MNIQKLVKIAQDFDRQNNFKMADKITTAMMKKESMFFLIKALQDAEKFNSLVNALNDFYNKRDFDYIINENSLRTQNPQSLTPYQTSEILWKYALEDLENSYKPIKPLDETVTVNGESLNFYDIKEKLIALCEEIEKFHSVIFDTHQKMKKPLSDLESLLTEKTIRDMNESNDPIPEE